MKKLLLGLSLGAFTSFAAIAQTATHFESDNLKAKKGDVSAELGLTGGILDSDLKLADGGLLKFRYYMKDDLALRMGLNISSQSEMEKFYKTDNTAYGTEQFHEFGIALNIGVEKHFKGTRNLSPYVGGDVLFSNYSTRYQETDLNGGSYRAGYSYSEKSPANIGFGVRAIAGADFYITKNVYLGAEFGLGFLLTNEGNITIKSKTPTSETTTTIKGTGSAFSFAPAVNTGFRIGFVF